MDFQDADTDTHSIVSVSYITQSQTTDNLSSKQSNENNYEQYDMNNQNENETENIYEACEIQSVEKEIDGKISQESEMQEKKLEKNNFSFDLRFISDISFICNDCREYFFFKFHNFEYMDAECKCNFLRYYRIKEFIYKYSSKTQLNGCLKHKDKKGKNKNFEKYCKDCKINLCEECLKAKSKYMDDNGKITEHETHYLIDLFSIKKEIEYNDELISYDRNEDDNIDSLKNIIVNLKRNYDKFPSYNAFKAIKSIIEFLKKPHDIISGQILKSEQLKVISSVESLKKNIKYSNEIYKIVISGDDTLEDLNILTNKEFKNLKKMHLKDMKKLKDITALANCKFPNLLKFIIEESNLTDDCINVIKQLKLPKIRYFSLFDNKITSPEILGSIQHFESLEIFYIGYNPFNIKKISDNKIIYNFPSNLSELGLSNLFTKETNEFIVNHLNLENIKLLFINSNGITSLKMFENIKFKQLVEFWVFGGNIESIEEIKYLQSKETIKKIVLKQNKIKDIEKLVDIIDSFPKLEILNIENNNIEKEKIEIVIKKIKEKQNKKLLIKYN